MGQILRRGVLWGLLALIVAVAGVLAPVAWVALACQGAPPSDDAAAKAPLIAPEHRRPEARTLMTYPEWHIVHAYDSYAQTIAQGDPHDFRFLSAIAGFWSATCTMTQASAALGGVDRATQQMVSVIGVSFTAELLAKAAYEESLGRLFAALRGPERATLDDLSATQARAYANFLQQVPWYRWNFAADRAALNVGDTLRDRERRVALGLEYAAKARYAAIIETAVAATGQDDLRLRMIVTGAPRNIFLAKPEVRLVAPRPEGLEIETPRYRQLTEYLADWAAQGATFVEIAGNDDILLTATGRDAAHRLSLLVLPRQGFDDDRHLILTKVADLAAVLRGLEAKGLTLEHVHDY